MSNDTREALAAVRQAVAKLYSHTDLRFQAAKARKEANAAIEELAALTEQPAAPEQAGDVEALRIQVRQADERGDEALRLAHAWEKVAVASGDWMPDAHGYPRWSASKARTAAPQGVQAEPLTLEEIRQCYDVAHGRGPNFVGKLSPFSIAVARAIEAAHGIGAAPAAPAQEPQQPERRLPDGLVDSLIASETPGFGLPSPAPAVLPEAVAELVEALQRARGLIEGAGFPVDTSIDRALAKHGQPQGGSNG